MPKIHLRVSVPRLPPSFFRRVIFRIFSIGLSIGLSIAMVEIVLRCFFPQPNNHLVEYRPPGFFFNRPNFSDTYAVTTGPLNVAGFRVDRYVLPVKTNSVGMRSDAEYPIGKTRRATRVLLLGDSVGFGFPVPLEETFATRLEGMFSDWEILNGSYVAARPSTLAKAYRLFWSGYSPDVVILQ